MSTTILESLQAPGAWWHAPDPATPVPPWVRWIDAAGRAFELGVPLALGTDAGNPVIFHGLAVHRELELLVRAGLTPLQALTAATSVAASKVGAQDRLGTVAAAWRPTSCCSGPIRSGTSRTPGPSTSWSSAGVCFDPAELVVH